MIMTVEKLQERDGFGDIDETVLKQKLLAVESLIRSYTHNNFQNRFVRFAGASGTDRIYGGSPFLKVGDTVQVTQSGVNDGLYVVKGLLEDGIQVDSILFEVPYNLVTKVEYPADVQEGVVNLLSWEINNRDKVGVKSETLSRHSVTYFDLDANNQVMGYPISLLGFLRPYMRGKF